jgi:hypothetical protein
MKMLNNYKNFASLIVFVMVTLPGIIFGYLVCTNWDSGLGLIIICFSPIVGVGLTLLTCNKKGGVLGKAIVRSLDVYLNLICILFIIISILGGALGGAYLGEMMDMSFGIGLGAVLGFVIGFILVGSICGIAFLALEINNNLIRIQEEIKSQKIDEETNERSVQL